MRALSACCAAMRCLRQGRESQLHGWPTEVNKRRYVMLQGHAGRGADGGVTWQIFNMMNVPYETVNILEDDSLRMGMKEYSQWPTFPQVYIDGEFYGGCDIMIGEPF